MLPDFGRPEPEAQRWTTDAPTPVSSTGSRRAKTAFAPTMVERWPARACTDVPPGGTLGHIPLNVAHRTVARFVFSLSGPFSSWIDRRVHLGPERI